MATDQPIIPATPAPKAPSMQPIVSTGEDEGFALDMPMDGTAPGTGTLAGASDSVEIGQDGKAVGTNPTVTSPDGDTAGIPPVTDTPAEGEGDDTTPPPVELPADNPLAPWDPANPEVAAAYEARYFDDKGKLNLVAVTKEFWSNAKEGKNGTLHEDTYKYLEETLGVTKEAAKAIEKGLVADQAQEDSRFWQKVGGKARYQAALDWGKATYSAADKARFNTAINGADAGARDDVVDALLARYERANPRQAPLRRGPPRRQTSPVRSVSATAEGAGTAPAAQVPYASQEAYTKAWQEAIAKEKSANTPAERRAAAAEREKVRSDGRASSKAWTPTK